MIALLLYLAAVYCESDTVRMRNDTCCVQKEAPASVTYRGHAHANSICILAPALCMRGNKGFYV
jgi:hypothetical protein